MIQSTTLINVRRSSDTHSHYNFLQYQDMKNSVVEQEHFLLRVIGFSTSSKVPHSHLLNIARYLPLNYEYSLFLCSSHFLQLFCHILFFSLRYLRLGNEEIKYAWMFLNDSFFDLRIISAPPAVIACSCIYLGIKASVLPCTRKKTFPLEGYGDSDHKWWTKLAVSDDILFLTCDWITKISLQRMISCSN